METYKYITIDWSDAKSIKQAEKDKRKVENLGYQLKATIPGLVKSKLIYKI